MLAGQLTLLSAVEELGGRRQSTRAYLRAWRPWIHSLHLIMGRIAYGQNPFDQSYAGQVRICCSKPLGLLGDPWALTFDGNS